MASRDLTTKSKDELIFPSVVNRSKVECYMLSIGEKNVMVVPWSELKIKFYDANTGTIKTIIGLVKSVKNNYIDMVYWPDEKRYKHKKQEQDRDLHPDCSCIFYPANSEIKYASVEECTVLIDNIIDIDIFIDEDDIPKRKGDIRVMLLGISAEVLEAIVINLSFFDSDIENAVKHVKLGVGGIYDLTYEVHGHIYESRVKIVRFSEPDKHDRPCKPGRGIVREHVGFGGQINECHDHHTKGDFLKEPPVRDISIIVDTSEQFDGNLETIKLASIRGCTTIKEPEIIVDPSPSEPDNDNNNGCNCGHHNHHGSSSMCFETDELGLVRVDMDNEGMTVHKKNGENINISYEQLIRYYLGA